MGKCKRRKEVAYAWAATRIDPDTPAEIEEEGPRDLCSKLSDRALRFFLAIYRPGKPFSHQMVAYEKIARKYNLPKISCDRMHRVLNELERRHWITQ